MVAAAAAAIPTPAKLPRAANLNFFVLSTDAQLDNSYGDSGIQGSIAQVANNSTLSTNPVSSFPADIVGTWITVSGFANANNNGTFPITARTANTITYSNPAGVNGDVAASLSYSIPGNASDITDRKSGEVYSEATILNQPACLLTTAGTVPPWPPATGATKQGQMLSRAGTSARRLTKTSSAVAALFQSNIPSSLAVYLGSRTGVVAPTGTPDLLFIGSTTNGIRLAINWGTSTVVLTRYEASLNTAVNVATSFFPTTPVLLGVTYDPVAGFINPFTFARGASAVTSLTPVAAGTLRSPGSMTQIQLMSSSPVGGSASYVLAWAGGANVLWGASDYLEIGKWVDTYGYAGLTIPT